MRILLIHNYYRTSNPSGENTSFDLEVQLLKDNGHEVLTYCRFSDEIEKYSTLQKFLLPFQVIWSIRTHREVLCLLSIFKPDLVHIQNTFPLISSSVYWACKHSSFPIVQSIRNYRFICINGLLFRGSQICCKCLFSSIPWPSIIHRCYRESLFQSLIIAASLSINKLLRFWRPEIDMFIHLSNFSQKLHIRAGFSTKLMATKPNFVSGIPHIQKKVNRHAIFIGRLSEEKGVRTMINAWTHLNIPLIIVGEGPLLTLIEAESASLSHLTVLGRKNCTKALDLIAGSSMLISPSEIYETFGRTIVEAFSCSVPVIASRLGARAEIVEDGKTGLLFTPGDAHDLARKVQWAWDHPEEMAEMGRAARREYEEKYTPERNYEMLMEIYKKAIEHHQNRRIRN